MSQFWVDYCNWMWNDDEMNLGQLHMLAEKGKITREEYKGFCGQEYDDYNPDDSKKTKSEIVTD